MRDLQAPPRVIPFEPRRFASAAAHYVHGRPPYAPRLIERVAALCGLQPQHAVLDLGCGPGQLATAFVPFAGHVLGIDPEPEMLRIAQASAPANAEFRRGSSYDIGPELGRFQLVTMGRSFHWMDREDVLRRLDGMVAADGAVALFKDSAPEIPENAWRAEFRALLDRYAPNRHRVPETLKALPHLSVLLASAFNRIEEVAVIETRQTPVATMVERAFSMSGTSPARLGDRAPALAADIAAALAPFAPDGLVTEVVSSHALIARRG